MDADSYAASFNTALDLYDALRARTLQREIGVSSLGLCHAQAQWMMQGVTPTDAPVGRQAFMGSAIHKEVGRARAAYNPSLIIEPELKIIMPSGVIIPGHPDEIDTAEPSVTDVKTVSGGADMTALRKYGASEQQRYQRHVYGYGAIQAGLVPEEGLIVRNVWIDRSGQSTEAFVEQEPFDMALVREADLWLSDVAWSAENNQDPIKDKHFDWCKSFCEFFSHCRLGEVSELTITDEELIRAARMGLEGRRLEKQGKELVESAKGVLQVLQPDPGGDVVAYQCDDVRVRYSWVNRQSGGSFTLHLDSA